MHKKKENCEKYTKVLILLLQNQFNPIVSWPSLHNTTMGQTIVSRIYLSSNFGYLRVAHRVALCWLGQARADQGRPGPARADRGTDHLTAIVIRRTLQIIITVPSIFSEFPISLLIGDYILLLLNVVELYLGPSIKTTYYISTQYVILVFRTDYGVCVLLSIESC